MYQRTREGIVAHNVIRLEEARSMDRLRDAAGPDGRLDHGSAGSVPAEYELPPFPFRCRLVVVCERPDQPRQVLFRDKAADDQEVRPLRQTVAGLGFGPRE